MRIHLCVLLAALLVGLVEPLAAQRPPDAQRVEAISHTLPAHPRGVGRPIDDRAAWAAIAKTNEQRKVINRAERLLGNPMPELTDELFLEFSRNGNRSRYQNVLSTRRKRLDLLVLAECFENQGRFLPEIEKAIGATCDEKTWVLPAHDRNLTNFKGTQITVDLRSSATGWNLATADYWLSERLAPAVRKRIRQELQRRIFQPYENSITHGKPRMWWLRGTNNWNAVCLANVTGAALANIESRKRRAFYVAAAESLVQNFLKGFTPNGYCSEGLGYWNYGFGHFVMLAETLLQATGGRVDLMADPRVERIARFGRRMEINPGVYPAFADCGPGTRPASWINAYVSRRFGFGWPEGKGATVSASYTRDLSGVGLFRFPDSTAGRAAGSAEAPEPPLRDWFERAGVLICRSNPAAGRPFGVAIKGGHNAEHHNHNDVGSYVVALGGRTPLLDPGSEVYTGRTFSRRRYQSGVLNSSGHPVPRIDGKLQRTGRSAAARVLKTEFTDQADTLALDLRAAYDVKALRQLVRTFVYSRQARGSLTVTDRVVFDEPKPLGTALITFDPWERIEPNLLRVGTGQTAVDVRIETGGVPFEINAEQIQEDLPGRRLPARLGIELGRPVKEATVTLTIRPAQ